MTNKLELNLSKDEETYRTFFGDDELIKENIRLYKALQETVIEVAAIGRTVLLIFRNGVSLCIDYIEHNTYNLILSDNTIYEYDDHSHTKLSKDRVLHYLSYVADINTLKE